MITFEYTPQKALNTGFLVLVAVLAARYFLVLPMAQLMLCSSILHFIAGIALGSETSPKHSLLQKTAWLSGPFFVAGIVLVVLLLANIFVILPLAAPISAFCGLYMRSKWTTAGFARLGALAAIWVLLTGGGYYFISPAYLSHDLTEEIMLPAPEFSLQTLSGETVDSQALAGKVVLIDFWGTWCGPCLRQFPELQEVYDRYKEEPAFAFLAINTGMSGDNIEKIQRFLERHPLSLPIAYDDGSRISHRFGVTSLPHTVLIDKNGMIRMRHTGALSQKGVFAAGLRKRIEALLGDE